jgi:hypothetical protein
MVVVVGAEGLHCHPRKESTMEIKIWQHRQHGSRYAVALWSFGDVKGAIGPLEEHELAEALEGVWCIDWDATAIIQGGLEMYEDVTEQILAWLHQRWAARGQV